MDDYKRMHIGYDPTYRPSLSARRALARMYLSERYHAHQIYEFSQSCQPHEILNQLRSRKYVRYVDSTEPKLWVLTADGCRLAIKLRASGEYPTPVPRDPVPPDRPHVFKPRPASKPRQRMDVAKFRAGYAPHLYLTDSQMRLLCALADQPSGSTVGPPWHTAKVLVRCGLAGWRTENELAITQVGLAATEKMRGRGTT